MPIIFQHYGHGVNAATHPRLLPDGTLARLVNGTVTSGFCDPRPPFIFHQVAALDVASSAHFAQGVVQGAGLYLSEFGAVIAIASDGYIFRFDVEAGTIEKVGVKAFSKYSPRVSFCKRGPYLIAQDGESPPVVIRHRTAKQGTHPTRSIPTGWLMAEGWGRLAVASPCRTKIYFGNHIADPNAGEGLTRDDFPPELAFTEDTDYFKNIRYFRSGSPGDRIVGMTFTPSLNGDGDLGPLAVFRERSTWLYNTRVPRELWGEQDIASNPLPNIGACGPDSISIRGNDILFSDQTGRIQQMRIAVRRNDDARLKAYDSNVSTIYSGDHATHLNRRISAHLPERHTLVAIHPEVVNRRDGRWTVRHRALLALNESPVMESPQAVWDGTWTGVHPVAMVAAPWRGKNTLFIISLDSDGVNRIYRLGDAPGYDVAHDHTSRLQPMLVVTRADSEQEPFKLKRAKAGAVNIGAASGPVSLSAKWIGDGAPLHWFTASHHVPHCLNEGNWSDSKDLPRMTLPVPPGNTYNNGQVSITVRGQARVEEIAIDSEFLSSPSNSALPCGVKQHQPVAPECDDATTYDLSKP